MSGGRPQLAQESSQDIDGTLDTLTSIWLGSSFEVFCIFHATPERARERAAIRASFAGLLALQLENVFDVCLNTRMPTILMPRLFDIYLRKD